jgi:hypothetical protein
MQKKFSKSIVHYSHNITDMLLEHSFIYIVLEKCIGQDHEVEISGKKSQIKYIFSFLGIVYAYKLYTNDLLLHVLSHDKGSVSLSNSHLLQ